jgi:hypothetical protein
MYQSKIIPPGLGPFYVAMSATVSPDGSVLYRMLRQDAPGDRLQSANAGSASPACGHPWCRLANLGAAAVDWAYLNSLDEGLGAFHGEQLHFEVGPE